MSETGAVNERRLSILLCDRRVPAEAGNVPLVAVVLRELGHDVEVASDGPVDFEPYDAIMRGTYTKKARAWALGWSALAIV